MKTVTVDTTVGGTVLAPPGIYPFGISIANITAAVLYVSWDGTAPTTAAGFPVAASTGTLHLSREQSERGIKGIVAAASNDVRVQGVS